MTQGRLVILFLVLGPDKIDVGFSRLLAIAKHMFPDRESVAVIIDNARTTPAIDRRGNILWISGDNRVNEFSGWDRGYRIACEEFALNDDDLVLFANDSFDRHAHLGYLDALTPELIAGHDLKTHSIGFCDDFPQPTWLMGLRHQWWFRSNLFIHPKSTVDQLYPLCFPLPPEELFTDDPAKFFSEDPRISRNWKAYVYCWLFGERNPEFPEYNLHWYKAERAGNADIVSFRKKALCMLSEHYMGARLANLRRPVIDFNKLERTADRHLGRYEHQFLTPPSVPETMR